MVSSAMSNFNTEMIRVRLYFDNSGSCSCLHARKVWMVVNFSTCKVVEDLENAIIARFFGKQDVKLSLYLDDFVLPSDEVIQIIRDNDVVRVEVTYDEEHLCSTNGVWSAGDEEHTSRKRENKRRKKEKKSESGICQESGALSSIYVEEPVCETSDSSGSKVDKKSRKRRKQAVVVPIDLSQITETGQNHKEKKKKKKSHKHEQFELKSSEHAEPTPMEVVDKIASKKKKSKKERQQTVEESHAAASSSKSYVCVTLEEAGSTKKKSKTATDTSKKSHAVDSSSKSPVFVTQKEDEDTKKKSKKVKDTSIDMHTATESVSKRQVCVTQKRDENESGKNKTKRTTDTSKEECSTSSVQTFKDIGVKKMGTDNTRPLTKQDIDQMVEQNQKTKSVDKPIGQRLLEISQNSNVSFKSNEKPKYKPSLKPKGHVRFSSSSESSSSSDSESSSSGKESKKSSTAKGNSLTPSSSVVATETVAKSFTAVREQTTRTSNVATDVMKNSTNENKRSHFGTYSETTDSEISMNNTPMETTNSVPMATDNSIPMATENGTRNGFHSDVAMKEDQSWGRGIQQSGRGRRGQQRGRGIQQPGRGRGQQGGWNPMSKKGQLNTQLSNKSILMQNPKNENTNGELAGGDYPTANGEVNGGGTLEKVTEKPVEPKDYTTCPSLVGPPRAGDKIAYKILELSNIYCPEVSDYKEAEVLSYTPEGQMIMVKLSNDQLPPPKRHGRFELHFDHGEEEMEKVVKEPINLVSIQLSSLIEPKLL